MAKRLKALVQEVLISEEPEPKDSGGSDMFRGPDGKFYKVLMPESPIDNYRSISAIQIEVKGRTQPLFVSADNQE